MHLTLAGTITIEQVGSYAGFASILGLAVLAALYFSQARDVRRLRDWAGRAPERDAEARARVAAATPAGQQAQQAQRPGVAQPAGAAAPAAATPAVATPAVATPAAGNNKAAAATPSKAPAVAAGAATAGAAAGAGGAAGNRPGGITPGARALGNRPSAQTSVIGAGRTEPAEPWYRRMDPKYIALILAGILVVGGGIAVGAFTLLSGDNGGGSSGGAETQSEQASGTTEPKSATVRPGDISVAVLNATGIAGLADQFADKAEAQGFKRDNVGNAPGGQRAESVVLYAPGKEREARLLRRKFNVSNIEPVDPDSQGLAPDADVFLVIGADNTQ